MTKTCGYDILACFDYYSIEFGSKRHKKWIRKEMGDIECFLSKNNNFQQHDITLDLSFIESARNLMALYAQCLVTHTDTLIKSKRLTFYAN